MAVVLAVLLTSVWSRRWTKFFCVMCDVYIHPPVEDYKIFDFNALDKLVDCGYVAMYRPMDGWRGAVSRAEWQD